MGCWNETCMMSNLPIMIGEEVYLFVLAPTTSVDREGRACYADDRYVPVGFPILGKYNDYGGIDSFNSNPIAEQFFQSFDQLYYYDRLSDDKALHDYQWSTMEQFIDDIVSYKLYIDVPTKGKKVLSVAMVHKELYESLIDEMSNRIPFGYNKDFYSITERSIYTSIEKLETARNQGHVFAKFTDFALGNNLKYKAMNRMIDIYLENEDACIIHGITDYMIWMEVMSFSRKGYHNYSGAGGQDHEFRLHHIIAEFILDKCVRYEKQAEEDGNDDVPDVLAETVYFYEEP